MFFRKKCIYKYINEFNLSLFFNFPLEEELLNENFTNNTKKITLLAYFRKIKLFQYAFNVEGFRLIMIMNTFIFFLFNNNK